MGRQDSATVRSQFMDPNPNNYTPLYVNVLPLQLLANPGRNLLQTRLRHLSRNGVNVRRANLRRVALKACQE
jgi:hypothetical protein